MFYNKKTPLLMNIIGTLCLNTTPLQKRFKYDLSDDFSISSQSHHSEKVLSKVSYNSSFYYQRTRFDHNVRGTFYSLNQLAGVIEPLTNT